ncbi:MAG: glycosyltransferase family 4 protein, partial [Paludibacteraceae bacterium]|nr:glycosyltransferase family 4 protein [Paludibacteraceae bacterium]
MPKKILIHSLVFSPDGVSTAYLYNDIALRFQQAGYDVRVLTTSPHFNIVEEQIREQPLHWGVWGIYRVSSYHGIKVYHVPQHKFKRTVFRILGFVYWHIISFFIALFMRHVDVILSPSPPLSLGVLNLILKRLKGCRVIYNVQEIYPDIMHLNDGWVLRMLKWAERKVYNKSDAVTTIDQVFHDNIVGRFRQPEHLHIIPNFVDTSLYHADIKWQGVLNEAIFPQTDSLKLLYAGNIGKAQAWQPLIDLAVRTKDLPIEFFVIGKGALRDELQQQIEEKQLTKIHLLPYQPRQLMPAILSYSDIQFIFMDPQMEMQGFPS